MTGITLKVDLKDKKIIALFKRLEISGKNLRPVFLEIGEHLLQSHEERFSDQVDPEGNAWEPLSDKYKKRKKKNQDLVMILDGFLKDNLAYQETGTSLEFGSNSIYAATHQFGDENRNIPARPFIGLSDADEAEIIEILHDYLNHQIYG